MPDYTALINQILGWILLLAAGMLILEFTLIHLVAKAARMKNRSYNSFYWLSFVFRSGIMWLIVASLPFNKYDPRSPYEDHKPELGEEERYINPWSKRPLLESVEKGWIIAGLVAIVIAVIGAIGSASQAANTSNNPYSMSAGGSNVADGTTTSTDKNVTSSGCTLDLTSKQVSAGYYNDTGDCLAYRWTTSAEEASNYCSENTFCTHAYITALSNCDIPTLQVDYKTSSDKVLATDYTTSTALNAGDRRLVEVGTSQTDNWSTAYVTKAYCAGHD